MSHFTALLRKDARVVYRDRFLALLPLYAVLIALIGRFLVGSVQVENIEVYAAPALVVLAPMLIGTVLGFALIEEREQGTWLLLRVLPLRPVVLFAYMGAVPVATSFVTSLLCAAIYGEPVSDMLTFLSMTAATSTIGPLMMLIMGAGASNKIEGLVLQKIVGATVIIPALIFFVPMPWQLLLAWCPWYWIYVGLLDAYAADPATLVAIHWPGWPVWVPPLATLALCSAAIIAAGRAYIRRAR